jgi:stress response protein SCP2
MILDVLPKIINTFSVLISDEGIAASKKSFYGLIRIHRLFLALAERFPRIKAEATRRIQKFKQFVVSKTSCPSLGNFLPLLLIVDEDDVSWISIRAKYISESLTRSVLWVCKTYPELERTADKTPSCIEQRLKLTREAARVGMRLSMLQVHFISFLCQGTNKARELRLDNFLENLEKEDVQGAGATLVQVNEEVQGEEDTEQEEDQPQQQVHAGTKEEDETNGADLSLSSELSFITFRRIVNEILTANSWTKFFEFMRAPCPKSKTKMAEILRNAVKESARKKYHTPGMDFSRVHASGTSRILKKGQKFTADGLQRVVFHDNWTYDGGMKYLDATCLVYKGKKLVNTVDYSRRTIQHGIRHSGDEMGDGTGSHTIHLDLASLDTGITSCIFVLSAWAEATLLDIESASVSFVDADAVPGAPTLCWYDLDAHDKIPYLKSVIMCKLYKTGDGRWHVLAIGDSYRGSADNYGPIYEAAQRYL